MVSQRVLDLLAEQQQAKTKAKTESRNTTTSSSRNQASPQYTQSKVIDKSNQRLIVGAYNIVDINNSHGELEEFLIKSPSSGYSIIMQVDREQEYQRTWTELNALSDDVNSVTALLVNGSYVINIGNTHFTNNVKLTVVGQGITFTKLYARVKYAKHN